MPKLTIDGKEITVDANTPLIQACELAGAEIPRFCYHSRLAIAGNCRMCLVEVEKSPKPVASCAMPVTEGMIVHTNSELVKKARAGVMEFLLINHPLDCPICDQAGECDLQDQAYAYGRGTNRFELNKRAVKDKNMGPLIKTHMTRCIHCTRCVRFATEIAGVEELGALGRGEHMEISTYVQKTVKSELSGNMIDICPVGALTSKPYAFKARSWELKSTESVDVLDAVGSNIKVDARGLEVMRILPRLHEDINEEWISDKTRFSCDGLKLQRIDRAYIKKDGKLTEASLNEAINLAAEKLTSTSKDKIASIVGDLVDAETIFAAKELMNKLGVTNLECRQNGAKIPYQSRADYLFNTSIAGIEDSDLCLIIGANPRIEATMINARLRKRYLAGNFKVLMIGEEVDLTYKYDYLGDDPTLLNEIYNGIHPATELLKNAKNPMVIIGEGALIREDGDDVYNITRKIASKYNLIKDDFNGFNILHTAASKVAALDLGFVNDKNINILDAAELVYLIGADEIPTAKLANKFIIYQGHHGDASAHLADIILPASCYTEKEALYVNLEGRVQKALAAVMPPKDAMADYMLIIKIAEQLNIDLGYKDLNSLRVNLYKKFPNFSKVNLLERHNISAATDLIVNLKTMQLKNIPLNYYMSNAISRASKTMAECVKNLNDEGCNA